MSIKIPQPSMALNAVDAPGKHYRMWNTWEIGASETADHIIDWTASVASGAPDGYLRVLVINCHGYYNGSSQTAEGLLFKKRTKYFPDPDAGSHSKISL